MASAAPSALTRKPFSIANFRQLFNAAQSRQYMSDMEVEQVRVAIEDKNVALLGQLYEILLKEQATDEEIVREFVMTKNRLVDKFMVDAVDIEKKMVQGPIKQAAEKAQRKEEKKAEKMLEEL